MKLFWDEHPSNVLLTPGGSPNYRDGKGLTPLYLSVLGPTDPQLTQVRTSGAADNVSVQPVVRLCHFKIRIDPKSVPVPSFPVVKNDCTAPQPFYAEACVALSLISALTVLQYDYAVGYIHTLLIQCLFFGFAA